MGTWDFGPFDNDSAADFSGDLDAAAPRDRAELVRATLDEVVRTGADFLDSREADRAVAAAALIAAQCPGGQPVDTAYGPDEPLPDLTAFRELAHRALDRVVTAPSEAMELWEEADGAPWHENITRLKSVLTPDHAR
ncbi:DUF4259 domain-containing protein [Streptomyces sp. NPDC097619]|uniref:DUF4259 domain-containing protein n=1 Tax=Streptomyces sp. NPDC097619 TaxID=3157228 RepID=UPI0033183048